MKKSNTEEFIKKANKIHKNKYDYSKVDYIKSCLHVCIICPEHGEFWQTPNKHLNGRGCPECGIKANTEKNVKSNEQFIKECKQIYDEKYSYIPTEYKNSETKVTITCHIHGEFSILPKHFLNGYGCQKCRNKKVVKKVNKKDKLNNETFIIKARDIHGNKYDYSKVNYINKHTEICIICPEHGEFWQTPDSHLRGHGCKLCGYKKLSNIKKIDYKDFVEKANKVHNNKYIYNKTDLDRRDNKGRVIITCPFHGDFLQRVAPHLKGQGCPKCNQSHMEKTLLRLFKENNIEYYYQQKFEWMNLLSLDFYLPTYNLAIECQGRQHFQTISHFGGNKGFNEIRRNDIRKKELCNSHNIRILYYVTDKRCKDNYFLDEKLIKNETELLNIITNSK